MNLRTMLVAAGLIVGSTLSSSAQTIPETAKANPSKPITRTQLTDVEPARLEELTTGPPPLGAGQRLQNRHSGASLRGAKVCRRVTRPCLTTMCRPRRLALASDAKPWADRPLHHRHHDDRRFAGGNRGRLPVLCGVQQQVRENHPKGSCARIEAGEKAGPPAISS